MIAGLPHEPRKIVPLPDYAYACVDRSVLVRPFCQHVVRWFVIWMPRGVPANYLTLGSSACMWALLGLALARPTAPAGWSLGLMALYVLYDHADGMHARCIGTSGPLGEFLDHYLDVFHAAIAIIAAAAIAGLTTHPLIVPVIWAILLGSAATMVEQLERGELQFGRLGPLEGMLLMLAYFASWCPSGAADWWHHRVMGSYTRIELALILGAAGGAWTAIACCGRIGRFPGALVAYAATSAGLGVALLHAGASSLAVTLVMMLHAGDFIGGVLRSHLCGSEKPWPDWIGVTFAVLVALVSRDVFWPAWSIGLYLGARNLMTCTVTIRTLRHGWCWWNPRR